MKETRKGILKASQKGLEYEVDTKHYERTKKQRLPPSIMKGIDEQHHDHKRENKDVHNYKHLE